MLEMGVLEYGNGVYGIGNKGRKGKHKGQPHFSVTQHIEDHL